MTAEDRKQYHHKRPLMIIISIVLLVIILALSIYSLKVNSFELTFEQAFKAVMNRIKGIQPETYYEEMVDYVTIDVNGPRTVAAILVGMTLAICGSVMQTLTRNPLTDPYTIGISSAALFGVTISISLGINIIPWLDGDPGKIANAFIFALVPAMAIVFISSFKKISPTMMILIGIGMMYVFSAFNTFLKVNADEEKLQEIYIWSIGTLTSTVWEEIIPITIGCLLVLISFMVLSKRINVLLAGDNLSHSLGVNPVKLRIICFIIISVGVAICVCFTGTIGFVGLVAPHIARLFTGSNNKVLIPASALIGALMILVGDIIVRSLPGGLPVGVVTALIGSPIFIYFLFKQRRNAAF